MNATIARLAAILVAASALVTVSEHSATASTVQRHTTTAARVGAQGTANVGTAITLLEAAKVDAKPTSPSRTSTPQVAARTPARGIGPSRPSVHHPTRGHDNPTRGHHNPTRGHSLVVERPVPRTPVQPVSVTEPNAPHVDTHTAAVAPEASRMAKTATNEVVRDLESPATLDLATTRMRSIPTSSTTTSTSTTSTSTTSTTTSTTTSSNAPWKITVGGKTFTIESGTQSTIDACKPGMVTKWYSPFPGEGGTTHLAGHNYCGFQYWADLPLGTRIVVTHGTETLRYTIVSRTELTSQGGSAAGLIHDDLILQTCRGAGTSLTYARRV